jgi:V/A-type H+-transporting ATPase subunit E
LPLKDLLNAIEAEANEESARLESESRAEADAILAQARTGAARAREKVLCAHAPATAGEAARRVALARLEASRLEREAREEAFAFLLAEVRTRLAAARDEPGYRETLRVLMREALAALPDATTARVNPADEALAAELARQLGADLTVAPDPGVGGVVLESADGRVVRNTFEERLANAAPRLRPWYGRRLRAVERSAVER